MLCAACDDAHASKIWVLVVGCESSVVCRAQVRFMVRQPMIVDDSTADDVDDDELELVEGAAAAGQATAAAASSAPQGDAVKKSVRLAADGKQCLASWACSTSIRYKLTIKLHFDSVDRIPTVLE